MEADLFTAHDRAALLAIRKSIDAGRLRGRELLAAFVAAGLMGAPGDVPSTLVVMDGVAKRAA